MAKESEEMMRKGPWTKAEDLQLACSVTFFGDRRWDFIARVSVVWFRVAAGLNRTGKSCRMRWLNYLHPSLKRGRMTPQEEGLILELHSRWGNRWSRIARRLPGRTDNEIKNYWRTHMRKKAQEQRETLSAFSPSASSSPTSASPSEPPPPPPPPEFTDDGQLSGTCSCCSMDQIWDEIDVSEEINALIFHE